jgi:putative DNA primase/helicase
MGTREAATGKWPAILAALGIPAKILDGNHHPCPIPGCGGKDRFRYLDKGVGNYICAQCGAGQGLKLLQKVHGWDFKRAAGEIDKIIGNLPASKPTIQRARMTSEDVARMWKTSKRITSGDAAGVYLSGRGISLAEWPKALRYVPRMWYSPGQKYYPCMLALYRSADDKTGTVHRTYLAKVEKRRMFVPFGVPKGGAIRLSEPDLCMGIAEGIETALSASLLYKLPVWATTSELMLQHWQPPDGAKRIWIFGDNDSSFVGQTASYILAKRLAHDGYHVTVQIPPSPDWDWNDVLKNEIDTERYPDMSQLRLFDSYERRTIEPLPAT